MTVTSTVYEFWEHGQSGEVFAVRLTERGEITGCHGPLLANEIKTTALPRYRYEADPVEIAWIERHRENWMPSEFQAPPHY